MVLEGPTEKAMFECVPHSLLSRQTESLALGFSRYGTSNISIPQKLVINPVSQALLKPTESESISTRSPGNSYECFGLINTVLADITKTDSKVRKVLCKYFSKASY